MESDTHLLTHGTYIHTDCKTYSHAHYALLQAEAPCQKGVHRDTNIAVLKE